MRVIKQSDVIITNLVKELKRGKVIVYPTETCYGLGCDATNTQAVNRLFAIKKRARDKAVLMIIHSVEMIKQYVEWTPLLEKLAREYWPGALTVVIKVKDKKDLADGIIASDGTAAFRLSDNSFARQLCHALDRPLISTSANISGRDNPYNIETVLNQYQASDNKPDIIIDAGELPRIVPSTIIKVERDNIEILRQGELVINYAK